MAQETEMSSPPFVGENCQNCNKLNLAYVGGLFDGEGTIHFSYHKPPCRKGPVTSVWASMG